MSARELGANAGVTCEHDIQDRIRWHRACGRRSRSSEAAWLVAVAHSSVSDLLWLDDHADCGAGSNHRVSARPDSRALPRQQRIVRGQDESATGPRSVPIGEDPDSNVPDSNVPGSSDPGPDIPVPVNPIPVNPGSNRSGPVFPGRTATPHAKPSGQTEAAVSNAIKARVRSGG
jgi:hypothetical protein